MKTTVAVIGASGFLGSRLEAELRKRASVRVTAVRRGDYEQHRVASYDVVINCAMPAARFRAKKDPSWDFRETVEKTADIVYGWTAGKFVQVSTVSARCQLDTVYGRHKAAAEVIAGTGENLIVRMGSMYDETLKKGVLIDLLHDRTVFVARESRYCFAPLGFVAEWIASNLDRSGVVEVGARNAISLGEVADHLGSRSEFAAYLDHQEIFDPEPGFPDAADVLAFLDASRDRLLA